MKNILLFFGAMLVASFAMGQARVNDPTYSIHNYKHANKAAYARKHNLDKMTELQIVDVKISSNYKQPRNNPNTVKSGGVEPRPMDRSTVSYKHPRGL